MQELSNRHYLVTGGCGFIGGHLVRALIARGHRVRVLDDLSTGSVSVLPANADLMVGDVSDPEMVADALAGTDGAFHLAAIASVERCNNDWLGSHRTNVGGTVAVMEAARAAAIEPLPVVWASSAAIYGAAETLPIRETTPTSPLSPYGADKLAGELHGQAAAHTFGLSNTAMRFFNVYGPGQDPHSPYSGVISIFAERLARGETITINGDGRQTRDFIYVGDVVEALVLGMERLERRRRLERPAGFDALNICTGRAISVQALAETLLDLTGGLGEITYGPERAGDIKDSVGDPAMLNTALKFRATTSLTEGLTRLLEEHREAAVAVAATG